jgi:hypothetical protein
LWDVVGAQGTFIAGAVFAALALGALPGLRAKLRSEPSGG